MCLTCMTAWVMYAITAVTLVAGLIIMGVGSGLAADADRYLKAILDNLVGEGIDGDLYLAAIYIMIPVGTLLCVAAGLGCWGAWRRKPFWLTLFNIIAMVILVLVLVAGILASVYQASYDSQIVQDQFTNQVRNEYSGDEGDAVDSSWDSMQDALTCCGAESYENWIGSSFANTTGSLVPWSCCVKYDGNPADSETNEDYQECLGAADNDSPSVDILHIEGCQFTFANDVDRTSDTIMGVCFSMGLLNLVAVLVGCFLKGRLSDEEE